MTKKLHLVIGLMLMFVTSLSAQLGFNGHTIDKNLVFPHLAIGAGYELQVILFNPGQSISVSGTLYFFNQNGTAMQVSANSQLVTQLPVTIPAGGSQYVTILPPGTDLAVGWALFEVTSAAQGGTEPHDRVFGSVIFTHFTATAADGQVGVLGAKYALGQYKNLALPIQTGAGLNTGVAVANCGAAPATVVFALKDAGGAVVRANATITPPLPALPAGNQEAYFVTSLFPDVDFSSFEGTLELATAQEGMVALGLQVDGTLLTAIPVVQIPRTPATVTVTNSGFSFNPSLVTISSGDSVKFQLASIHDALEVSQATWNANGTAALAGGFSVPFGGGTITLTTAGTHYYVCTNHASSGMKGRIVVN